MTHETLTFSPCGANRWPVRMTMILCAMAGAIAVGGCVQVAAPDKPIVIELNINIKQEVVYRLDSKAQELIKNEAEIF